MGCLDENTIVAFLEARLPPDEVERLYRHLDQCVACAQVVFETAGAPRPGESRAATLEDSAIPAGAIATPSAAVGRYLIQRIVGAGGMGVVYAAHDPQLDRDVALKLLRAGGASRMRRERLMREAQAMARLSHRNVITVYEVGTVGDQLFVAMELIDGPSLAGWLALRPRTWREVLDVFLEAGRGLEAAHRAGLVHRDFKPDNVLVAPDGRVCVTDFGLARLAGESHSGDSEPAEQSPLGTSLTRTGTVLGTPAYMAPEQLRGDPADARADLFSFCVALYEALFGARPFPGTTVEELQRSIAEGQVRPAAGDAPAWLRKVVLDGLRADPAARPASMRTLLTALEHDPSLRRRRRAITGAALLAVAVAIAVPLQQARRQARSQLCQGGAAEIAAVWDAPRLRAAVLASGAATAPEAWSAIERSIDSYQHAWAQMHRSACEATRLRGEQSEDLLDLRMSCLSERRRALAALAGVMDGVDRASLTPVVRAAQSLPSVAECADLPSLRARVRPPRDPAVRARVEDLRGELQRVTLLANLHRYRQARQLVDEILAESRAIGYLPLLASALYWSGSVHIDVGDRAGRGELIEAAATALRGGDDHQAASSWDALVGVDSGDLVRVWSALSDAALGRIGLTTGDHIWTLADMAMIDRRWEEASKLYERAALRFRQEGQLFAEAQVRSFQGDALSALGRFDEARAGCRAVLGLPKVERAGSYTIYPLGCLGAVESAADRPRAALELFQEQLAAMERDEMGRTWTDPVRVSIALEEIALGHPETALPLCRAADRAGSGERGYGEGLALLRLGRAAEARAPLEEAVAQGSDEPWWDAARLALAEALWPKDKRRALTLAKEARDRLRGDGRYRRDLARANQWLHERNAD